MSQPIKTPEQVLKELSEAPGIKLTGLRKGSKILVETTQAIYELVLLIPSQGIMEISSTDQRLKQMVVGQMKQSVYDLAGKVALPYWIGKDMRMQFTFTNTVYVCSAAISASVRGDGWSYEVF